MKYNEINREYYYDFSEENFFVLLFNRQYFEVFADNFSSLLNFVNAL